MERRTPPPGASVNWSKLERVLWIFSLLLVALLAFRGGSCVTERKLTALHDVEVQGLLERMASDHAETVHVANQEVGSVAELLAKAKGDLDAKTSEASVLAELLQKSKQRVSTLNAQLSYLKGQVVIPPEVPQAVTLAKPPAEYLHRLDNGLVVARFTYEPSTLEPYHFQTYGQRWVLRGQINSESSTFLLFGSTSYDDELRPIQGLDVEVVQVKAKPRKLAAARLALGVTAGLDLPTPGLEYGASVLLPFLHPADNVDVIVPRLSLGTRLGGGFVARGGLDVVGYNVGAPLPWVDDLWLFLGASYGSDLQPSVDLTVATRL